MTTKSKFAFKLVLCGCLVLVMWLGLSRPAPAEDTNNAAPAPAAVTTPADPSIAGLQDFLRSYVQIQQQLREAQASIEKLRAEAATDRTSNAVVMENRLQSMEKIIASEHLEQLNGIAHLDRTVLIAASSFAFVGFLVLLLAAFLQWSAVHRLAAASANLAASHGGGTGEGLLPPDHLLEQNSTRFLALIDRLEQRIHDLEASAKAPKTLPEESSATASSGEAPAPVPPDKTSTINLLLSKSQTLLKLDKADAALDCLEEALALDPGNADALVRKGAALERLQRLQEAIDCYDRAIARDSSLIMAYLYKAGVFNRLERHSEALACYEQALRPGKAVSHTLTANQTARLTQPSEASVTTK